MSNKPAERTARRGRSEGFTLFEVVVALAIAAVGLGLLLSASSTGLGNARLAYNYVEAVRRARSHLAEISVTVPLVPGARSGDDGDGFSWSTRISPPITHAASASSGARPSLGLYDVEVSISWRSGESTTSVALRTQRMGGR